MKQNTPHLEKQSAAPQETPAAENVTQEELGSLVEAQGEVIAEQSEEIKALKGKVESLMASVPAGKPAPIRGSFTLDGKDYTVLHGVQLSDGSMLRLYTPADIEGNVDVQRELIAIGSGAIQPIN